MTGCARIESGQIELYFYGELDAVERVSMARHVAACAECRQALEELAMIRQALAARPAVSAPPDGDWSGFMTRLTTAVAAERVIGARDPRDPLEPSGPSMDLREAPAGGSRRTATFHAAPYLAMAALVALVTMSVAYVARTGWGRDRPAAPGVASVSPPAGSGAVAPASDPDRAATIEWAFALLSEQHLERSKLVVLGLANKDAQRVRLEDWEYERELASSLLTDTRLYRMAAEERGLKTIADVMRDLELVLLQTSLAAESGPGDLAQIQRLIDKRDLVTKIELAAGI
jgi:hypothetical protein